MQRFVWILGSLLGLAVSASAAERHYVVLFGVQPDSAEARLCHSFGVFMQVPDNGEEARQVTISWMPAGKVIRLLAPPEVGRNFSLKESLAWAAADNLTITVWGPFEIRKELYDQAVEQADRLRNGAVAYKAWNPRARNGALNCIQALSDIVPGDVLNTGTARGNAATAIIVRHYRPFLIEPEQTHPEVLDRLGLSAAERRALQPSTSALRETLR